MTQKKHNHGTSTDRKTLRVTAVTTAFLATMLLVAGAGTAGAFTGCNTLSSPGGYTLDADITDSGASSCVEITSSNVVLDGQNNVVDGDGTGGIGIKVTGSTTLTNVTVRDVNVTEWNEAGIVYDDAGNGLIKGVNVTSPASIAYDHIVVNDSDGTDVTDSKASGDPLQGGNGVVLAYTDGSKVRDNVLRSNDNRGLRLRFSNDTLIEGNKLINNNNGLRTESRSSNATIRDNNASLNDNNGIDLSSASGHDVINNTLIGNGNPAIETSLGSTGNNITENRVVSTPSIGIDISTANNVVTSNVVRGSDDEGIRVSQFASGTVVRDNVLVANDVGLQVESGGTVVNNTVRNNAFAAFQTRNGDRVSVENLDVGMSTAANTTLDFEARNVEVRASASPPSGPMDEVNIGRFIEATSNSASHFLDITFQYKNPDISGVNETTLDVWKNNGTWTELGTGPATDAGANEVQYNVTNVGSVFGVFGEKEEALFARPLIDRFDSPPTNIQKDNDGFDDTLHEDLDGDGEGTDVSQTVAVFGELIRGNTLNGDAPDGSLTDEQARALNWNSGSPETEVTPADMVSLFGKQIRAD